MQAGTVTMWRRTRFSALRKITPPCRTVALERPAARRRRVGRYACQRCARSELSPAASHRVMTGSLAGSAFARTCNVARSPVETDILKRAGARRWVRAMYRFLVLLEWQAAFANPYDAGDWRWYNSSTRTS